MFSPGVLGEKRGVVHYFSLSSFLSMISDERAGDGVACVGVREFRLRNFSRKNGRKGRERETKTMLKVPGFSGQSALASRNQLRISGPEIRNQQVRSRELPRSRDLAVTHIGNVGDNVLIAVVRINTTNGFERIEQLADLSLLRGHVLTEK